MGGRPAILGRAAGDRAAHSVTGRHSEWRGGLHLPRQKSLCAEFFKTVRREDDHAGAADFDEALLAEAAEHARDGFA